ncbi:hypothetical protein GCM10028781_18230 [Nostocoides australiense]
MVGEAVPSDVSGEVVRQLCRPPRRGTGGTATLVRVNSPSTSRRGRAMLATVAVVAGTGLLGGCQLISPRQTDEMYDAADGVSVDAGDVQVRNLVVVRDRGAASGVLSGAIGNPGAEPVSVTFATADGGSAKVDVPAYTTLDMSTGDSAKLSLPVKDEPGSMTALTVSTPAAGHSPVSVPVLPATGWYADYKAS